MKAIDYMRTASDDEIMVMICVKFPDKIDSTVRIRNFFNEELSQEQIEYIRSFTAYSEIQAEQALSRKGNVIS